MKNHHVEVFLSKLPTWIELSEGSLNYQLLQLARNIEFVSIQQWIADFKVSVISSINPAADSDLVKLLDYATEIEETEILSWLYCLKEYLMQHYTDAMDGGVIGFTFAAIEAAVIEIATGY